MDTKSDLYEVLIEYYNIEPVAFDTSAYKLIAEMPTFVFVTILKPIQDEQFFLSYTSRSESADNFDAEFAEAIFKFFTPYESELDPEAVSWIFEGFHHKLYGFDSIMVISPKSHGEFEFESKDIHDKTFIVFPIYRCEFSGDESPKIIERMRRDYIVTADINRSPKPVIWMRYMNTKSGVRSVGKKLGLDTLDAVHYCLREMAGAEGSFLELKNYKDHLCKIMIKDGEFTCESADGSQTVIISDSQVISVTEDFLIRGVQIC